ncbi:MAG: hypothetical protein ABJA02_00705 [Acidobacteriota bacterium]
MRKEILSLCAALVVGLFCVGGVAAQDAKKMDADAMKKELEMGMDMAAMKNESDHKLMMAYMRNMSAFAVMLRDQALTPKGPDADFDRAIVAELRHDFDTMESIRQKHMEAMSPEMMAKMKTMMDKMVAGQAMVREHVVALETAVRADQPDAKYVAMHANDLIKHFGMMRNMEGGKKPAKKPMTMEKKPTAEMKSK